MAGGVLDRRVGLAQCTDARARDPELQALMLRVRTTVRPELADRAHAFNLASLVTVRLRDGRVLQHEVKSAMGTPANPLSESERLEKFRDCAAGVIPEDAIAESADRLLHLDSQPSISPLMTRLAGPAPTAR